MRTVVTGAAGFVGMHACRLLATRGHEVTAVVRRPAPVPNEARRHVVVKDLPSDATWDEILAGQQVIIHLAGRAHVLAEDRSKAEHLYREANVELLEGMTRAALRQGVRRIVYVSTIKVNGEATVAHPFTAADTPAPEDIYGRSKLTAEERLRELSGTSLEWVVLRPPLMYGPGIRGNMARLFKMASARIPVPFASIRNARDLLSVTAFADLLAIASAHPQAVGRVLLACDGQPISTPDLYRKIADALGRRPRLLPVPPWVLEAAGRVTGRIEDIRRLTGDMRIDDSETRRLLGWAPSITMDQELAATARWFESERNSG